MTMEMIVDPTRAVTDRRPPERPAKNAADDSAGDGADRTCNNKARPGSGRCTDPVGARERRSHRYDGQDACRQDEISHQPHPPFKN